MPFIKKPRAVVGRVRAFRAGALAVLERVPDQKISKAFLKAMREDIAAKTEEGLEFKTVKKGW